LVNRVAQKGVAKVDLPGPVPHQKASFDEALHADGGVEIGVGGAVPLQNAEHPLHVVGGKFRAEHGGEARMRGEVGGQGFDFPRSAPLHDR